VKVSRTVLRGAGAGNGACLPDLPLAKTVYPKFKHFHEIWAPRAIPTRYDAIERCKKHLHDLHEIELEIVTTCRSRSLTHYADRIIELVEHAASISTYDSESSVVRILQLIGAAGLSVERHR
jgi:superfamily II RNA helicase